MMVKFKLNRRQIRWARVGLSVLYFALFTVALVREARGQYALARVRAQIVEYSPGGAAAAYGRMLRDYPLTFAAVPARQSLAQLKREHPAAIGPMRVYSWQLSFAERWFGLGFRPESVDWLPLLGWMVCGLALLPACFIRIGRRSHWSHSMLALAGFATLGTLLIWAWYGLSVGRWASWLAGGAALALSCPMALHVATWALIIAAAALVAAPLRRQRPRWETDKQIRPSSPTDPRMAILYLDAQRAEKRCSASEYSRRRDAILAGI